MDKRNTTLSESIKQVMPAPVNEDNDQPSTAEILDSFKKNHWELLANFLQAPVPVNDAEKKKMLSYIYSGYKKFAR